LLRDVDALRLTGTASLDVERRSELGQFLTPIALAEFMASMFGELGGRDVRLLEAGAGVGSLVAALCAEMIRRPNRPRAVAVVAYEIEPKLIPCLERTLAACGDVLGAQGVRFSSTIVQRDFISESVAMLTGGLFAPARQSFHLALLNPPYGKIRSDSPERQLMSSIGIEATNSYAAFVALAARLLEVRGELVAITPRSFCNGPYFRPFREELLGQMSIRRLHLFESREQAFSDDKVLQENVIIHAVKVRDRSPVEVSMSDGVDDDLIATRSVPYADVVGPVGAGSVIRIVPDDIGDSVSDGLAGSQNTLEQLGLSVSTGRVVDFRVADFLRKDSVAGAVPLIYPGHFEGSEIRWPRVDFKKSNAILLAPETRSMVFPAGCYVLVKRLSAKEERRRIVAAVYEPVPGSSCPVAFENHVNVFHAAGGGLQVDVARGLCAFLNSGVVDAQFRQFNGHTQVNATDLRSLRFPSLAALCGLGGRVARQASSEAIDELVAKELLGMPGANAMKAMKRLEDARSILKELGMPKPQQNDRSALTLLALLDLPPTVPWRKASNPLRGITPMMDFFRSCYGKNYAPNSRETVRRSTIHQFVAAGLAVQNPDDESRPTNSGDTVYQIAPVVLGAIRCFGSPRWAAKRDAYLAQARPLAEAYARQRDAVRLPVSLPGGRNLSLSAGGQNVLLKQVVEEFCARFTPGGEVLYLGDAAAKWSVNEAARLESLGVVVEPHGKMPDLIVYHRDKHWLLLVEAVTSHGPVNIKRHNELRELFRTSKAGLVFVTAFLDRKSLARYVGEMSWETEVWVADDPDHLIHFNGDRFLGPYLG